MMSRCRTNKDGLPLKSGTKELGVQIPEEPLKKFTSGPMIRENRQLVTDEPVEFE